MNPPTTLLPTPQEIAAAMEATWTPAALWRLGPWLLRDGAGGGNRVSAATVEGPFTPDDIALAEAAMPGRALFMLRPADTMLDAALAARGYNVMDPVVTYVAPVSQFAAPPRMTSFPHWPPLQIATDLWAELGIDTARLAVMHRAPCPKTVLLARSHDRPVGAAFVGLHGPIAMLHALAIAPAHRRQGSAQNLLAAAAHWSAAQGADSLTLVVTEANHPARALYERMGMVQCGGYHYRKP